MPRTKEIKLSSPLDEASELQRALRELHQADQLAERAVVRIFAVFRNLKFGQPKGPDKAVERLDRAHDQVGNSRFALKDAAHQLEQVLKEAGR